MRDVAALGAAGFVSTSPTTQRMTADGGDRAYWLDVLTRVAHPVLSNLAQRRLKEKMPVETASGQSDGRRPYTHLEALGRLLAGISPWLERDLQAGEENSLRTTYATLSREAIAAATDSGSPDFMNFNKGRQPLVDAAFLAHAILRAPTELWKKLDPTVQRNLMTALRSTRTITPSFSNWLMFSAMVEAALRFMGDDWDSMRVDYALRQHEQWYKGDGVYGDGPDFHWDYYNSFVIQPMLIDVLSVVGDTSKAWQEMSRHVLIRARRYAEIQERMISPEGTFPAIGRSLAYRFGAFQLLAQIALMHQLPERTAPAQVRGALTAVIRRMIEAPGMFDAQGWLTIGFCGHQPKIGERYISTGSVYLCAVGLLPLGLPPDDEFWKSAPADWTSRKIWAGQNLDADHAI